MNVIDLIPHLTGECLRYNSAIFFDTETKMWFNHEGVNIRPHLFGETQGVEYLTPVVKKESQYLKTLVDYFVGVGYVRGLSIRGAPYDFRLGVQELIENGWMDSLKGLVENTYEINNRTKVHLFGHSLGGPLGSFFLGKIVSAE